MQEVEGVKLARGALAPAFEERAVEQDGRAARRRLGRLARRWGGWMCLGHGPDMG